MDSAVLRAFWPDHCWRSLCSSILWRSFSAICSSCLSPGCKELSLILISWVVFFGAAYIYKKETLLRVDFLYLKAKGAVRLCWEMLWHILECAVLVILTIYGCRYAQSQSTGVTYSLGINRAAYSIPMIYCAASMLIGMIEKIYDSVVNYRQGKKEAT